MEKVCRERVPREGEIPPGMEKQVSTSETLHDESITTRQNDLRCQVRGIRTVRNLILKEVGAHF